jgi:hypothetical protein
MIRKNPHQGVWVPGSCQLSQSKIQLLCLADRAAGGEKRSARISRTSTLIWGGRHQLSSTSPSLNTSQLGPLRSFLPFSAELLTTCFPPRGQESRWRSEVRAAATPSIPTAIANVPINPAAARPSVQLVPFRAAAAISSSSRKDAASAVQPHGGYGVAKRERKEVPLPSQEGTKGVVQYALYVAFSTPVIGASV